MSSLFNGCKIKLLIFKGRSFNGEVINNSKKVIHLGHTISSPDSENTSLTVKGGFGKF